MMRNRRNSTGSGWVIWLVILLALLFGADFSGIFWWLIPVMIIAGIGAAIRWLQRASQQTADPRTWQAPNADRESNPYLPPRASRVDPTQVADRALRRAGNTPRERGLRVTDVGLLVYDGGQQPRIYRRENIPATATHLRPFMTIDLSDYNAARGTIQYDLIDDHGRVRFSSQERRELNRGDNFLTTTTFLPMGTDEPGGNWTLRVSVGSQLLALHDFTVNPDQGAAYRPFLEADGELSEQARRALADEAAPAMSLDELLSEQSEHEELTADSFRHESQRSRTRM